MHQRESQQAVYIVQFTRLRLNGFKSFVDPTDLVIANGLTGVVGPNGCGKSNLLEALRWVMGETRPSAMRGGGMEDVIFAGTASRPARNFAEVNLTVDNSERLAPAAFNESDRIEIVRRITRDAGSAYKVHGKDIRARDVQMLFADASTGAHSPALVRQGQISELINAKPKARRRILEEAAGISGLYQRRHEAELKLKSTETNLVRVDDVVEQLAGQIAQLARQARQAARYRAIGTELRTAEHLLLYLRWREADALRVAAQEELTRASTESARREHAGRATEAARLEAEEALPPLREEETIAAAVLQRLMSERDALAAQQAQARDRVQELEARLVQLAKDHDRETGLTRDAHDTIRQLVEERQSLHDASDGHEAALEAALHESEDSARVLQARESDLSVHTEELARLSAQHQSIERLLSDSRKTLARHEDAAETARAAAAKAAEAVEKGALAQAKAAERQQTATAQLENCEAALTRVEERRVQAHTSEAETRAARSSADAEAKAVAAEASALTRLVRDASGDAGQILDDVSVQPGFERALGAALGDDLKAPEVGPDRASGWAGLSDYEETAPLPPGADPLSSVVEAPLVMRRRLSQIGVVDADAGDALQDTLRPGQRLVSREGDLWRWDGLRRAAGDAPSAAALRLEQKNRLAALESAQIQADAAAQGARDAHAASVAALAEATDAEKNARDARRAADTELAEASRAFSRAEADRNLAEGRVESLSLTVARHEDEAASARFQMREAEDQAKALPALDAARERSADLRTTVEAARLTMLAKRSSHDELKRVGETRAERLGKIEKDLASWQARLDKSDHQIGDLASRVSKTEADLNTARAVPETLVQKQGDLSEGLARAEARKVDAQEAVSKAESALRSAAEAAREAERASAESREERARAETRVEAAIESLEGTVARIEEVAGQTPTELIATIDTDDEQLSTADRLEADVARLKRQRESLGAVNLRAEDDAREVQEEHDTLVSEKADLEAAISKLRSGIAGLNREGRERLLTAFEQVNENFGALFTHLFGGGEARLVLVESDDPLDAGLEILCQPPGKKLASLSLLSGGEQTLTAMALIFAVFLANPAPICVLDEVDAPLDDANVTRFCDMLDEMTRRTDTRFLIITHHAVTMSRMDRLFGVTMQEQGVSQLVSVDLKKAEALVA